MIYIYIHTHTHAHIIVTQISSECTYKHKPHFKDKLHNSKSINTIHDYKEATKTEITSSHQYVCP